MGPTLEAVPGVCYDRRTKLWRAQVVIQGRIAWLGHFVRASAAASAYHFAHQQITTRKIAILKAA